MNKHTIKLIIGLLSFCLAGIICFQIYWFTNAYSIKEEQFNRSVNDALNNVVERLENDEAVELLEDNFEDTNMVKLPPHKIIHKTIYNSNHPDHKAISDSIKVALQVIKHLDDTLKAAFGKISANTNFNISINDDDDSAVINFSNNSFSFSTKSGDTTKSIKKSKHKVASFSKVKDRTEWLNNLMNKMVFNFDTKESPIEDRIKLRSLDTVISKELKNKAINIPFEYAVMSDDKSNLISMKSKGFKPNMMKSIYRVDLFQKDIVQRADFLILDFPKKNKYIRSSLSVMMFVQIMFTFVIILVFAGAIFVMLRQKKLSDIKNDFISNMTHEFKTPISTINLAVDSINNPKVIENKEMIQNLTKVIKEENIRMNSHVENILNMSLIDKNELTLNLSNINIHTLVETAVQKIKIQIENREGNLETDLAARVFEVNADKDLLLNAILNILDNAIKYSPENPVIKIKTYNANNSIFISISDLGIGMTKESQNKIFEKFYRVSTGNIHNVKGFGLGLSYTKAIVDAHKGQITVKSELGKGSTFEVMLPVVV